MAKMSKALALEAVASGNRADWARSNGFAPQVVYNAINRYGLAHKGNMDAPPKPRKSSCNPTTYYVIEGKEGKLIKERVYNTLESAKVAARSLGAKRILHCKVFQEILPETKTTYVW